MNGIFGFNVQFEFLIFNYFKLIAFPLLFDLLPIFAENKRQKKL